MPLGPGGKVRGGHGLGLKGIQATLKRAQRLPLNLPVFRVSDGTPVDIL
jgi:hypothetical protein